MSADAESLFNELADLSPAERLQYFEQHRVPDDLRRELEALLRCDSPEADPLGELVAASAHAWVQSRDAAGEQQTCGPYRLVRLLGRGGMGAVYLGQRTDGEIEQSVAIKFLRHGGDAPQWKERFLRERQILASLRHPGIAHLLDAGHTAEGQPFLVMEYVEGTSIDVYCERLDLRGKLALFLEVCEAVAYAHRNLTIHRDLKPSNILVDTAGHPKLLDFGIAKVLDATTDRTRTRERMLTPEYASPEQVQGTAQTTATDVYSLGAVLYRLVTGKSPHVFSPDAGQSIEWVICNQETLRASRVNPDLPEDLDFILAKTLRKEPEARYASVDALMEDIHAFLEWRPVRARSGNLWYRARKFMRRYWIPVTAAAVAIAGLCGGLLVASRERAVAQRRFNEVRQLSNQLFDIDRQVRQLPGSSQSRQLIVDTSLDYLRRLAADVHGDTDLALDLGTAYMRVGRVQGVPISPNLGQAENAEQNLRIAQGLIESVLKAQPSNRTAFLRAAQIAHDRMILAQDRRPDTGALPLARKSEEWLDRYLRGGPVDEAEKDQAVIVGMNVANWYVRKNLADEGMRLLRRTVAVARATNQPRQVGAAQINLARCLRGAGDLDGALAAIREGVRALDAEPRDKSTGRLITLALALATEGKILGDDWISLGRRREGAERLERSLEIAADLARQDPGDAVSRFAVAGHGIDLARLVGHQDPRRALAVFDEVLARLAEIQNNSRARRMEVTALTWSTYPLRKTGRVAEARQRLDAAFARLAAMKLYPAGEVELGSETDDALRARADYEAGMGDLRRGIGSYRDLLASIMASKQETESGLGAAVELSNLYASLEKLHRRAGQASAAAEVEGRRLELWRHWGRKLPGNAFVARQLEQATARGR